MNRARARDDIAAVVCAAFVVAMITGWHEHLAVPVFLIGFLAIVITHNKVGPNPLRKNEVHLNMQRLARQQVSRHVQGKRHHRRVP